MNCQSVLGERRVAGTRDHMAAAPTLGEPPRETDVAAAGAALRQIEQQIIIIELTNKAEPR